jgi:LmbE family N-acetylglucosaminyl deacetylase
MNAAKVCIIAAVLLLPTTGQPDGLPSIPIPRRLLVVAPHPDDASLSAGLLMRVKQAGGEVRIVDLTCGDRPNTFALAFVGHARYREHSDSRVNYGMYRQMEDRNALRRIGLDPESLICMQYRDGSLWRLLEKANAFTEGRWAAAIPAGVVCSDTVPHEETNTASAVVSELSRLMREFGPDAIVLTHPNDNHRDHAAAYWLGMEAIRHVGVDLNMVPVYCPLDVYAANLPLGLRPNRRISEPRRKLPTPTRWLELNLSHQDVQCKIEMLAEYPSQMAWEHPTENGYRGYLSYIYGCVAQNELYGVVDFASARHDDRFRRRIDDGVRVSRFFGAVGNVFTDLGRRVFGSRSDPRNYASLRIETWD